MGIMNGVILLVPNKRLLGWGKARGVSLGAALANENSLLSIGSQKIALS